LVESQCVSAHTTEDIPELEPGQTAYRLIPEYAEQVRDTWEQKSDAARWN